MLHNAVAVLHAGRSVIMSHASSSEADVALPRGRCRDVYRFAKVDKLGEGTYGTVYLARDSDTGDMVALKRVILHSGVRDGFPVTSLREITLLRACDHPNIVKLKEVVVGKQQHSVFLVFEHCEHDMARLLDNMPVPFREAEIKCIMRQLLSAVAYMHERWIIHRDIKMSNLLYSSGGQLKVADFGLARTCDAIHSSMTTKVVTLWYRAPELLLGDPHYTTAVDVWSVGCILGELLLKRPFMAGKSEADQLLVMARVLGAPNTRIWPGMRDLPNYEVLDVASLESRCPFNGLRRCFPHLSEQGLDLLNRLLTYDPAKRITAVQALRHPYFGEAPLPQPQELMPSFPRSISMFTKSAGHSHSRPARPASPKRESEASAPLPTAKRMRR